MSILRSVVVGLDGAASSADALRWVTDRLPADGELHLVHAVTPMTELALATIGQSGEAAREATAQALRTEWAECVRSAGVGFQTSVVADDPGDGLIAVARDVGADAIVVGAHGKDRDSIHLGSVTRKLARKSPVPVIIGRTRSSAKPGTRVLACISYGSSAEACADWASEYSAQFDLPLELLHVVKHRSVFPVDPPSDTYATLIGGGLPQEWALGALDEISEAIVEKHPSTVVTTEAPVGGVVRHVLRHASDAEVVVLGQSHSDLILRGLAWSRTRQIVAHSPSTVVLVPTNFATVQSEIESEERGTPQ